MAGITLEQAQQHLDAWMAADLAVASNQSYTIAGRSLSRADAKEIAANVQYWERKVQQLTAGQRGLRVRYATL